MQGASAQVWNGLLQTTEDVIQRQACPAPEFDDDGLLGRGQDGTLQLWSHGRVGGLGAVAPFQDGFKVKAVLTARRREAGTCAALSSARILASCGRCHEERLPQCILLLTVRAELAPSHSRLNT